MIVGSMKSGPPAQVLEDEESESVDASAWSLFKSLSNYSSLPIFFTKKLSFSYLCFSSTCWLVVHMIKCNKGDFQHNKYKSWVTCYLIFTETSEDVFYQIV
jgi:hypothetical protein